MVYGPEQLVDMFPMDDPTILANYANFGHIPYGQSLVSITHNIALTFFKIGQIYYDKDNMDGCKKMELETSSLSATAEDEDLDNYYDDEFSFKQDAFSTKIVLLDRGNCSFVTKVRNAERAGASLVVVIDDREENITNVIMGDDGTGTGTQPFFLTQFAHGLNERIPVQSFYDGLDQWHRIVLTLAGPALPMITGGPLVVDCGKLVDGLTD